MIKNATTLPKVYYGLHMASGLAEYNDPNQNDGKPHRILVEEKTIKNMDGTFQGRPVYVLHKDEVNLENIQNEADGYVVESFFNKLDGKHWAKFIIVSDKGHEAIKTGWKLSNAYIPKEYAGGGVWHGMEYDKEVMKAEYEHLAIVPNPRYAESVILTPEEFKSYNEKKEIELKKLSNANEKGERSMFSFFKKSKLENSAEFEGSTVMLPKSKKEKTIEQVINMADEMEMKENEDMPMAEVEHYIEFEGKKIKVADLLAKFMALKEGAEKKNEEKAVPEKEEKKEEVVVEDSSDKDMKEEMPEEKKTNSEHFKKLANAHADALSKSVSPDLAQDKLARGINRYGSK